jgi:hypothetical protein
MFCVTAAALSIERGLRAVTRVRPPGPRHLDEVLCDADQLLTGARHV